MGKDVFLRNFISFGRWGEGGSRGAVIGGRGADDCRATLRLGRRGGVFGFVRHSGSLVVEERQRSVEINWRSGLHNL